MYSDFENDYVFKIIIIGNAGTGKTSLLSRLCNNIFIDTYISTIGIDFKTKVFDIDGYNVKLQIWDTAGQEKFKSIVSNYYRNINGIIVVFDLSDIKSFININNWMNERDKFCVANTSTIIVGTKSDIKKSELITYEMISEICIKYKASYIETSSKNNFNIDEAFILLCKKIIEKNEYVKKTHFIIHENDKRKNECCNIY
jgi:Ras-related protein Rab-1A